MPEQTKLDVWPGGFETGGIRLVVKMFATEQKTHVLNQLNLYKDFVRCRFVSVAEDTNINRRPVEHQFGPGALEAVQEFIQADTIRNDEASWWRIFSLTGSRLSSHHSVLFLQIH